MIVNMASGSYSDSHPNSTGSIRTDFSVGTGKRFVSEVLEIHGYNSENDRYDLSSAFAVQL